MDRRLRQLCYLVEGGRDGGIKRGREVGREGGREILRNMSLAKIQLLSFVTGKSIL